MKTIYEFKSTVKDLRGSIEKSLVENFGTSDPERVTAVKMLIAKTMLEDVNPFSKLGDKEYTFRYINFNNLYSTPTNDFPTYALCPDYTIPKNTVRGWGVGVFDKDGAIQ